MQFEFAPLVSRPIVIMTITQSLSTAHVTRQRPCAWDGTIIRMTCDTQLSLPDGCTCASESTSIAASKRCEVTLTSGRLQGLAQHRRRDSD